MTSRLGAPAGDDRPRRVPDAPLAGVVVLDFGLAIAGPFGAQILADLGATVIKVTTLGFDLTDAIYVGSSRGKQALAVDLKHPRGQEIAARLIARADVVHHNMRTGVAERLGIGYEQAKAINPAIIYCHTRGFERNGPRTHLPGNDQLGHALAGSAYEAGGTHHGTPPIWQMCAYGDTGNGVHVGRGGGPGAAPPGPHRRGPVRAHLDPQRVHAVQQLHVRVRRRQRPRS